MKGDVWYIWIWKTHPWAVSREAPTEKEKQLRCLGWRWIKQAISLFLRLEPGTYSLYISSTMYDENWEEHYQHHYDSSYANLEFKMDKLGKDLQSIQNELEHLYIYQGHAMDGRSESKEREIEAMVHAYEVFIRDRKKAN